MGLPTEQRFPRTSAVGRYWLARCEGFRARSGARDLGTIEQVRCTSWQQDAYSLVIKGRGRRLSVPVDRVLEIDPWAEMVVLAPSRHLRKHLGRSAEAAGRMSLVTARAARGTAQRYAPVLLARSKDATDAVRRGAERYGPVVLEHSKDATVAVKHGSRRAATWSAPRARRSASIAGRLVADTIVALAAACAVLASLIGQALAWLLPRLRELVRSTARLAHSALRQRRSAGRGVSTLDR